MRRLLSLLLFAIVLSCLSVADDGMWLFNQFPSATVKAKYGFAPDQKWLDHVRLSSVRFNNGGSGSFVSPDGLTFTNHHVGADCIQKLSTSGKDYMKTGYYAATQAEEAKCPDLELNVLVGIEDVTSKVRGAVKSNASAADAAQSQRSAMSSIEKECAESTGLRCDVITFYSGEVYNLYKYKKYTDVRLVFAPEFDIAFFGGDPDNFTYPRYDLDISFFRVYENDKPARLDNFLSWSKAGGKEGDLTFVSGHPGATGRLRTMAQMDYLREVEYPSRLVTYKRRIDLLKKFASVSEENARVAKEEIFGYENAQKAIAGYKTGLDDKALMASKAEAEAKVRAQYKKANAADPDPWSEIESAMTIQREIYAPLTYVERMRGFNSDLVNTARVLVRVTAEKSRPNGERLREYRDSALPSLEQELFSLAPVYKSLEAVTLADSLAQLQEALGADNPIVKKALSGKTPSDAAKEFIEKTRLDDVTVRKQLYEGGTTAIDASDDPLIVLMRTIDPDARAVRKQYDDAVDSVERRDGAAIAKARFAQSGYDQPPDATFTLRLSYGDVRGYTEAGKPIPYTTNIGGIFERAAAHGNKSPYQLPERWVSAKSKLDLKTPFNFVSTSDIIGGNSGSPVVNKSGEVVGIIFDGNIQSLPWNFAFSDKQGRSVQVDSRGILEALRKVYAAEALANELVGNKK